ncbi:MAG: 6-bladed beta-propeller [Gemmataceae bacterium]|nr:6-bladed beta-propeller [Gemmataceae bacterium]
MRMSRRAFAAAMLAAGCRTGPAVEPELVWGRRGVSPGSFFKPRAAVFLPGDILYLVDFTARIQAFDADGRFQDICWSTPEYRNGRPSGLGVTQSGNVIVCDSHYHTIRVYDPGGKELYTRGGNPGNDPGQFGYVSDCIEDAEGYLYISEFGANERITKMDAAGNVVATWGEPGLGPRQFNHIRALALGKDGLIYVADACNHRIQVYDRQGKWQADIGRYGDEPGQFMYPYDVAIGPAGDLFVVELGHHRVQKLSLSGQPRAMWGGSGRERGKLFNPWALAVDSKNRVHVIDSENHRVQRIRM